MSIKQEKEIEFKSKNLSMISKIRIFKSKESEEIIQGIILNSNSEEIVQEEYIIQNDSKGKELKKGVQIKGKLEVMLDKYNYDKLVNRNEENKSEFIKDGNDLRHFVNMYEFIETQNLYYIIKI
jgi:hypothetical protein